MTLPGARMRLVGGDSGRYERAELVDEVLLAPSERAVVDVLFTAPGQLALEHRTPQRTYPLASITVTDEPAQPAVAAEFAAPRIAPELDAERQRLDAFLAASPDKILALVAEMDDLNAGGGDGPVVYACPMHPEVTSTTRAVPMRMKLLATQAPAATAGPIIRFEAGRCPTCGMKLMSAQLVTQPAAGHDPTVMRARGGGCRPRPPRARGWARHGRWDRVGGRHGRGQPADHPGDYAVEADRPGHRLENAAINWQFRVGDRVKIRLVNEMDSDHPMHHPFHLHGAGRFLVLARDGVTEPNLVWKDTVLVRTGQVVDILFDVSKPGLWMAHCHIAEHMQSGMMFSFTVAPTGCGPMTAHHDETPKDPAGDQPFWT